MYERALNGIRIGRFMGKWDCKYMELLLSAKPKLTYRNPLNVRSWAIVIVWISPLYCIYVFSGGCTRKVLTCWRHKGHDIRPQRTFLSVLHLRLTMCCRPSNDFMYLSPPWSRLISTIFCGQAIFFCWQYTGCPKKCVPLPILSICFVTKTKITIWAESICGISPFFFLTSSLKKTLIYKMLKHCVAWFWVTLQKNKKEINRH